MSSYGVSVPSRVVSHPWETLNEYDFWEHTANTLVFGYILYVRRAIVVLHEGIPMTNQIVTRIIRAVQIANQIVPLIMLTVQIR